LIFNAAIFSSFTDLIKPFSTVTYDQIKRNAVINLSGTFSSTPSFISYNAFNLITGITQVSRALQIVYGPDNMQIKTIFTENQSVVVLQSVCPGEHKTP
jgi:hypothetical protein